MARARIELDNDVPATNASHDPKFAKPVGNAKSGFAVFMFELGAAGVLVSPGDTMTERTEPPLPAIIDTRKPTESGVRSPLRGRTARDVVPGQASLSSRLRRSA